MASEAPVDVPKYNELLWASLVAVRQLGHRAALDEINERVIENERFTEEQMAVLHKGGPRTLVEYRIAWARSYLKGMGLLANPARGVWETTPRGREAGEEEIEALWIEYRTRRGQERREARRATEALTVEEERADGGSTDTSDWPEELLRVMLKMSPEGFEHLAKRLLRAAGFINTTVTVRSGDGGIDGTGVYRLSLVSFPVFFQCKRYKGSVGPDKVRDFRGAMAGRGDKGLLITTGTFTTEARREATRDGAPPIDLIDGEQLCQLLKDHQLGVRTVERTVEDVEILPGFFAELGS